MPPSRFIEILNRYAYIYSRFKRIVRLGVKSLWNHRLRSLLTVLGIVFGVCSVIAMLAIGEGASYEAQQQIRQLGSNNIIIRSVKPPEDKNTSSERSSVVEYGLTYEDVSRIRASIPNVTIVVPGRIIRQDVWNVSRRVDCTIEGTVPWYPEMTNHVVAQGRFFTDIEMEMAVNVCTLGATMAKELFPFDSPLDKTVRVGGDYYRVVGVMETRAARPGSAAETAQPAAQASSTQGSAGSKSQYQMFIPLTAGKSRIGEVIMQRSTGSFSAERVELHEVTAKVDRIENVVEASSIIDEILKRYRKKNDYEIVVPLQLLRQAEETKRIYNIVLGTIAGISLLVGGIGIMNIMLASVTERTREIGIRRAMGAKRRDIIVQFLIETVILSATGGAMGVVLGLTIPFVISHFAHMKTIVTFWSPAVSFLISGLVGIVFGIYPAMRAASMDPVEALRHE
jgi:putative ABC transport system permease protein